MGQFTSFSKKITLNLQGKPISLETPAVMGVLNITPDSFYRGSRINSEKTLLKKTEEMLNEGVAFIDIGGYSSRPGSDDISQEEELGRVIPAIKTIIREFPDTHISIDTFRSTVAKEALDAGAAIINDIAAGNLDPEMFNIVKKYNVPYIMMHMRGTPQNMKEHVDYEDLLMEIMKYFEEKFNRLLNLGVKDIIIDPGFGFAKTIKQNYKILANLQIFHILNLPILVGVSRKSMIFKSLEIPAEEALNGTTVLNTIALMNGANILRVHDVKEAVEAVKLYKLTYH